MLYRNSSSFWHHSMPSALRRCEGMYSGLPTGKLAEGKTYTGESERPGEKVRVAPLLIQERRQESPNEHSGATVCEGNSICGAISPVAVRNP